MFARPASLSQRDDKRLRTISILWSDPDERPGCDLLDLELRGSFEELHNPFFERLGPILVRRDRKPRLSNQRTVAALMVAVLQLRASGDDRSRKELVPPELFHFVGNPLITWRTTGSAGRVLRWHPNASNVVPRRSAPILRSRLT